MKRDQEDSIRQIRAGALGRVALVPDDAGTPFQSLNNWWRTFRHCNFDCRHVLTIYTAAVHGPCDTEIGLPISHVLVEPVFGYDPVAFWDPGPKGFRNFDSVAWGGRRRGLSGVIAENVQVQVALPLQDAGPGDDVEADQQVSDRDAESDGDEAEGYYVQGLIEGLGLDGQQGRDDSDVEAGDDGGDADHRRAESTKLCVCVCAYKSIRSVTYNKYKAAPCGAECLANTCRRLVRGRSHAYG